MIDERLIFIVICVVLSPIAHDSSSFAGEIETFNFNAEHNKAIAKRTLRVIAFGGGRSPIAKRTPIRVQAPRVIASGGGRSPISFADARRGASTTRSKSFRACGLSLCSGRSEIALDLATLPSSSDEELSPSHAQVPQPKINLKHDIDHHHSELRLAQENTRQQLQKNQELTTKPQAKTKKAESKLETLNSQATTEETQILSRRWSLVGMAITSLLSLIILWSLFQTEEQKQDQNADSELGSLETQDSLELIDEETELFDEESIISEQLPGITVLESEIEPNSNRNRKSRTSVGSIALENLDRSNGPQFATKNTKDLVPKNIEPRVEANVGGKVKIVTSNTAEIDVVFELIQDLQLSDRDLRRKAIWELAQKADSRTLEPLVKIMPQVDPLDKNLILDAITQIALRNVKQINDTLFTSLQDANSEVRKNAICDLVILYKPVSQITERLNKMLNDSDQEVRQTAKWALNQFNQTSISPISQDIANHG